MRNYIMWKRKKIVFICISLLIALLSGASRSNAKTASSLTQYGITWAFHQAHEIGQFANGDYWVVGPVTITSITPAFDGRHNGWEVNPIVSGPQGLEEGAGNFSSSLVPSLPYKAPAGSSLLKVISVNQDPASASDCYPACLTTASVLTVVETAPPDNGATIFRPPYVGADKPYYSINNLRTNLLPSLKPVGSPPTISDVVDRFKKVQLNHKMGRTGRIIRPSDHMNNYQPKNTQAQNNAILRMMLNDSIQDKMPALIQIVQFGIDLGHSILLGQTFPAGGGHQPGHRIVAAFAATMLDIQPLKDKLNNATFFHEERYLSAGANNPSGNALWGEACSELQYWNYIMGLGGSRSRKDPYGYIDGGKCGAEYQLITSQAHKGEILATYLMPSLKSAWNPERWAITDNYVKRWVEVGTWAQPDPCAPYDGNVNNYGITYGPDPANPDKCILDTDLAYYNSAVDFGCQAGKQCGRFPDKHGSSKDGGMYYSSFIEAMWHEYLLPKLYLRPIRQSKQGLR